MDLLTAVQNVTCPLCDYMLQTISCDKKRAVYKHESNGWVDSKPCPNTGKILTIDRQTVEAKEI